MGMSCKTEVDGTAGAPVEPVSEEAMLENDSLLIPCEWLEWSSTAVGAFMSSSASSVMLSHSGRCVIVASVPVKSIVGMSATSLLKLSMSAGSEVTSTMQAHRVPANWLTSVSSSVGRDEPLLRFGW